MRRESERETEREEGKAAEAQVETVRLTCQMAALAGSAQHASSGAPAIWRIASRL